MLFPFTPCDDNTVMQVPVWSNLGGKLGSCVTQRRRRSIHCTCRYCENILLHPVFRSLSTCGAPRHWWLMGRRPSTQFQNHICLSTSSTVQGCATRQRRFDSVCSKVLWHLAYFNLHGLLLHVCIALLKQTQQHCQIYEFWGLLLVVLHIHT